MTKFKVIAGILSVMFLLSACAGSVADELSSRTGFAYSEDKFNDLTGINAVAYHSDQCSLWVFGDADAAASLNGDDFPGVSFSYKGQDVKTGKQVLLLADTSSASCVEPTLNSIFGRTLSASGAEDSSYATGDYEASNENSAELAPNDVVENPEESPEQSSVSDCGLGEVELEVSRVGKTSTIEVIVVNISNVDCYIDLGPGDTRLSISDGSSWLWQSDDCLDVDSTIENSLIKVGQSLVSASYQWDRSQSTGDGCSLEETGNEALPSGLYYFKAELASLRLASSNRQFRF